MNRTSQTSGNFGWLSLLSLAAMAILVLFIVPAAQAASPTLSAAPAFDQGSALLVGVMGMLYLVRRRRLRH